MFAVLAITAFFCLAIYRPRLFYFVLQRKENQHVVQLENPSLDREPEPVSEEKMDGVNTAIGLFQFAIDTLARIQLARDFQDDFEIYQMKLEVIRIRLSRWGEIADITTIDRTNNGSKTSTGTGEGQTLDLGLIKSLLEGIYDRLHTAQREAGKIQRSLKPDGGEQPLDPETDLPDDLKKIRNRFITFLAKRKVQASKFFKSIKWVFYKKEHFDRFVRDISELIEGLEQAIPENDRQRLQQLSEEECRDISKAGLEELKSIVDECDPWLGKSVEEALGAGVGAGNVFYMSRNRGHVVGIHHGDNKGVNYGDNGGLNNTFT
ncbi:prion-inhibition and propagation-domain-containing protein [Aspergillus avenaceus]|uniref:Prion-inhibition and propagation-domain-containing protein n=1 Tax=Aspergillus avenaceus TaxID=36643 RepID=A0A5N6TZ84_ASPAV|nr:prion-inhibition and propagation-domain-containing protein [Aspergillus avenaceus]